MTATPDVILGGSGFIGTALARALRCGGTDVRVADVQPSAAFPDSWIRADVRSADDVARACAGSDTVFLLAAEHGLAPRPAQRFEDVNVGGARAVVQAAEREGVRRIVFTSTVAVYGRSREVADERAPCTPTDDYGRTKLAAEGILSAWAAADSSRALAIVRPTIVFGPGVRGQARSLLLLLAHPRFVIAGSGTNRKSLAHVDNLAGFLALMRQVAPGIHTFNYADGPDLALRDLASLVRDALHLDPVRSRPRAVALLRAAWRAAGLPANGEPALSLAQVRSLSAPSMFASRSIVATGFQPALPLAEAVRRYALSDLRWASPAAREVHVHTA